MARVDLQSQSVRELGRGAKPLQFSLALLAGVKFFRESTGVEFDKLRPDLRGRFYLLCIRRNEQAHFDVDGIHALAGFSKRRNLSRGIESSFRGDFLTAFRNDADDVRLQLFRDG